MEEADRKPPKEFFRLVDAVARHPRPKRRKEPTKTDESKGPTKSSTEDSSKE